MLNFPEEMFKLAFLVLALVSVASARIRSCTQGVTGVDPLAIRITGCPDNDAVCRIVRGTNIIGEFDFVASKFSLMEVPSKYYR